MKEGRLLLLLLCYFWLMGMYLRGEAGGILICLDDDIIKIFAKMQTCTQLHGIGINGKGRVQVHYTKNKWLLLLALLSTQVLNCSPNSRHTIYIPEGWIIPGKVLCSFLIINSRKQELRAVEDVDAVNQGTKMSPGAARHKLCTALLVEFKVIAQPDRKELIKIISTRYPLISLITRNFSSITIISR
jgi:hypothetical protein